MDNSTPTITANLPLDYSSATGIIRGIFDSVPTNSSINFLNSNVIYDALQLKQDEITSSTNLTTGNIGVVGNLTAQGQVSRGVFIFIRFSFRGKFRSNGDYYRDNSSSE